MTLFHLNWDLCGNESDWWMSACSKTLDDVVLVVEVGAGLVGVDVTRELLDFVDSLMGTVDVVGARIVGKNWSSSLMALVVTLRWRAADGSSGLWFSVIEVEVTVEVGSFAEIWDSKHKMGNKTTQSLNVAAIVDFGVGKEFEIQLKLMIHISPKL